MGNVLRLKKEELARLRVLRGFRYQYQLADAAGMKRQQLEQIMSRADAGGVSLRSIDRLCAALSAPGDPVRIQDVLEYIPDEEPGKAQ